MAKKKILITIGIDEVGRGALAGPVTVAALALPRNFQFSIFNFQTPKIKLRDSKKLSPRQREQWFAFIKQQKIPYAVSSISPKIIDKINISNAANLAATKAVCKLISFKFISLKSKYDIFLDGGLYLNESKLKNLKPKNLKTIVKGDEKIPAVSLASIIAKITRDRYMKKLHKKYPRYDFINNVGYGVKKHITAVKKFGRSPMHRKSFKIKN